MKTPLVDCHSHSAYSGHGTGTVHEMVEAAQKRGLAVYAQTEHLTLPDSIDPKREDSMSPQTAQRYVAELAAEQMRLAAERCPMELVCGVEADWLPGRTAELEELCKPYDYVIGSIHFLKGLALDNSDDMRLWEQEDVDGVWEAYLNAMEDMVRHSGPIRCLGHLDLPKVFGMRPSFDLVEAFGDLASLICSRELMIEVNCAGWFKKAAEQYPSADVLRLFAQLGVPCTVGCDAHKPEMVGMRIEDAYRVMYDAGYRHVFAPSVGADLRRFELA